MKTFFKSLLKFLRSIFLQVILGIVALVAFDECQHIGKRYENQGALSMAIICSACIIMIVWLEINKQNRK